MREVRAPWVVPRLAACHGAHRLSVAAVCCWDPYQGSPRETRILRLVHPVEALAGGVQTWMARP